MALSASLLAGIDTASAEQGSPPSEPQVLRIAQPDAATRQRLGLWFGHIDLIDASGDVRIEADAYSRDRLHRHGIGYQLDPAATDALHEALAAQRGDPRAIPGYACYRTVEETLETIDTLIGQYPELASAIDIGVSWRRSQDSEQGWPLRVLRLTNRNVRGYKPKLFAMAAVHAREYTTSELMTRFAEQLLAGHGHDADATWLLDHNEFHLLLAANPDGRKRAEAGLRWRKNENSLDAPCSSLPTAAPDPHAGVDLNRNFPWGWNQFGGSSGVYCAATYRGPEAASEPETQAVRDYVLELFPDTRPGDPGSLTIPADETTQGLFLDVHSYSRLVLWPWGGTQQATGNADQLTRLGRRMAWFNQYQAMPSVLLYPTDGTTIDFAYGELGLPAYTFELGTAFFQSCAEFESTILPDNLAALRYAARTLHAPYRLPAGPDAYDLSLDATKVIQGTPATLRARIDDSRYQTPGAESPSHAIVGATVFVNRLPWQSATPGLAMLPVDGSFGHTSELAELTLDTSQFAPGRHLLVVQGHDIANEDGPPAAIFLDVLPNDDWIFRNGFE